jgi:hypothetical protein
MSPKIKKVALIILLSISYVRLQAQQTVKDTSISAGWGNMDFAVPESPAFQILGTNPDNIIKPTSAKAATLNIGDYFLTNGPVIPKSLAVEISPFLLADSKVSLYKYNHNKFLYRMRLSFGTSSQQNGNYAIAEGLRFTILDKTDLRTDTLFNKYIGSLLQDVAVAKSTIINTHIKELNQIVGENYYQFLSDISDESHLSSKDSVLSKESDDFLDKIFQESNDSVLANHLSQLSAYRDQKRNSLWNKQIWEAGIASLQSSSDSLINNLKFSQIGLWSSLGFPVGKKGSQFYRNSQLLIGIKGGLLDSTTWETNVSLGARLFYGGNNVKGYVQGEWDSKNQQTSFTTTLGCQFNISSGLWGQFALNFIIENGKTSFQPGFNIGLGTAEKKKS